MKRRRRTIGLLIGLAATLASLGTGWAVQRRLAGCAAVPLLAGELLPNAALAPDPASPRLAAGWGFRTSSGVELQRPRSTGRGFDLDGDDRALQLIGIANYIETPPIAVRPGASYCFSGFALTDEPAKGGTRAQVQFHWADAADGALGSALSEWQNVALWQPGATGWSALRAAAQAPAGAARLRVRIQPAGDNRLYLDAMHVRRGGGPPATPAQPTPPVQIMPWPQGYQAALSLSFDWETTMGGLVHSRSLAADDPYHAEDPRQRGLRMRQGITTTLALFREFDIRATYYATGYNFLAGNAERRQFLGNPTFGWATPANGWQSDWSQRPWFSSDPYGTLASDPDYYFADLVAQLKAGGQDIQSHTFSHLYGGYASPAEWQADFAAWQAAAQAVGVAPARSLAFPWSSSGGMSDASWSALEQAGITAVTRTNRSQSQYQLTRPENPRCAPVPGHPRILACPDFYLTTASEGRAIELLEATIAAGGMIDLWAHTEEVVSPAQIAAWHRVVQRAAAERAAGRLWIASLAEIADWQQSSFKLSVLNFEFDPADRSVKFALDNSHGTNLDGLSIQLPFATNKFMVNTTEFKTQNSKLITVNVAAGQTVEVQAWPA